MEDNKNLGKENTDNTNDLNRELEELAELFRCELKKATEDAEKPCVEDDTDNISKNTDESSDENRKVSYGDSENRTRKLHFEFTSILAVVAVMVAAVMAVIAFSDYSEGYSIASRAKKLASENRLNSSIEVYDEGIKYFEDKGVEPKELYLESADLIFRTMSDGSASMDDIVNRVGMALDDVGFTLPVYNESLETRKETIAIFGTMQAFYSVMQKAEYASITTADESVYNDAMADVEALKELKINVKSIDGESSTEVYADECMIRFCQYMLAHTTGRAADAEKYLNMAYELKPEYLWLHAYEVGVNKIKAGDIESGIDIAEKIIGNNAEEADGYCLYSYAYRKSGDSEKAIEWAKKGLILCPENAELYRYEAMAHIAAGDYESAKKSIDKGLECDKYALLYYTSIVAEKELGNIATVNSLISSLEKQGFVLPEILKKYIEGTVTAQELFTKGTGDFE